MDRGQVEYKTHLQRDHHSIGVREHVFGDSARPTPDTLLEVGDAFVESGKVTLDVLGQVLDLRGLFSKQLLSVCHHCKT